MRHCRSLWQWAKQGKERGCCELLRSLVCGAVGHGGESTGREGVLRSQASAARGSGRYKDGEGPAAELCVVQGSGKKRKDRSFSWGLNYAGQWEKEGAVGKFAAARDRVKKKRQGGRGAVS